MRKSLAMLAIGLANILKLGCLFIILKDNDFILSIPLIVLYFIASVVGNVGSNAWSNEALRSLINGTDAIFRDIESQNKKILEEIENLKKGTEPTVDG